METPNIEELYDEIHNLRSQVQLLKSQLEKYTNNDRHKRYYNNNKDRIKQNAKRYIEKLKDENPDKLKEYRKKAYMNRKQRETSQN
jgi:hypothetical protein